jgi:hypothetical protein
MERDNEREIWRLRWEYLKRSKLYKAYCEWMREKREKPDPPMPESLRTEVDKEQKEPEDLGLLNFSEWNFAHFGDVHNTSFEDWWQSRDEEEDVSDYSQLVEDDFDMCVKHFKVQNNGREPSLEEFRSHFVRRFKTSFSYVYLKVHATNTVTNLKEQFGEIVKERQKHPFCTYSKGCEHTRHETRRGLTSHIFLSGLLCNSQRAILFPS